MITMLFSCLIAGKLRLYFWFILTTWKSMLKCVCFTFIGENAWPNLSSICGLYVSMYIFPHTVPYTDYSGWSSLYFMHNHSFISSTIYPIHLPWNHYAYWAMLTLNVRGRSYLGLTRSMSWLLMPWLLTSPWHQQPWYIEYVGPFLTWVVGPSLTWVRILSICVKSVWRNDIKCK